MTVGLIVGTANLIAAIVIIVLAIPLIRRRIPKNYLYGIRFAKSLESDENWYRINEYGGRQMAHGGVILAALAVIMLLLHHQVTDTIAVPLSLIPVAAVLVPVWNTLRFARRL